MARLVFESAAKLRRLVYIRCFVVPSGDEQISVKSARILASVDITSSFAVKPHDDVNSTAFILEVYGLGLYDIDFLGISIDVDLLIGGRPEKIIYSYDDVMKNFTQPKYTVMATWQTLVADENIKKIIDIGGRARSGVSRKGSIDGKHIDVADIVIAPDVDIVSDVHDISKNVKCQYDAFMSIATFEHLVMPWKAAIEINKILRVGALGLVVTHQTVGMHEVPWDFFRYSSSAWKGIFNQHTGFEIVDSGMILPAMIIPRRWQKQFENAEDAVGYLTSSVVVRKLYDPSVDWPVSVKSIVSDFYPH